MKIYSNRVDDTYSTSHRILESLSRNGVNNDPLDGDDDDEDGENADGEVKKKAPKARVGTKASSSRLNMTSTIEKNPALLNAVKLEHDVAVDPLFHKMSKAFDEGGAKGMLLYNMVRRGRYFTREIWKTGRLLSLSLSVFLSHDCSACRPIRVRCPSTALSSARQRNPPSNNQKALPRRPLR